MSVTMPTKSRLPYSFVTQTIAERPSGQRKFEARQTATEVDRGEGAGRKCRLPIHEVRLAGEKGGHHSKAKEETSNFGDEPEDFILSE